MRSIGNRQNHVKAFHILVLENKLESSTSSKKLENKLSLRETFSSQ